MTRHAHGPRRRGLARLAVCAAALASLASAGFAAPASADVEWTSELLQAPTNLQPGQSGIVRVIAANSGDTDSSGFPSIAFQLPTGLTLDPVLTNPGDGNLWSCSGDPVVTCVSLIPLSDPTLVVPAHTYVGLSGVTDPGPGEYKVLNLMVDVAPDAPVGIQPFAVTLDGGGDTAVQNHTIRIGTEQLGFGPTPGTFAAGAFDQAGGDFTQGGGRPYQASASFDLNTHYDEPAPGDGASYSRALLSEGDIKDIVVDVPPGFVGNPTVGPRCPDLGAVFDNECPAASQVGVASVGAPIQSAGVARMFGVFNVVPDDDSPAQFAFRSPVGTVLLKPVVRSDGDLGLSVHVKNVTQADTIFSATTTLWGTPADPSHDAQRCARPNFIAQACVGHDEQLKTVGNPDAYQPHASAALVRPFLSNPTACSGEPLETRAHFSQWADPGNFEPDGDPALGDPLHPWVTTQDAAPPVTGCDQLQFAPRIDVHPTTSAPDSPTGLRFRLEVPQNDDADGLATAHVRNTVFTLPEGMTVNPSSADGLAACSSAQIGLTSSSPVRFDKAEPSCPLGSKIGTVEVETSLLDDPLTGDVFVARQADNPFGSLLALYLVVRGPGIMVKLAGLVEADAQTGRLTTTVVDNPQLPFDALTVDIAGGPRAPLTTPSTCGPKTASAALTSWAGHSVVASDSFDVACPGTADLFDPSFSSGTTGVVAGAYSPAVVRILRGAGKELGRLDMTWPKGLLASVKHVAVCGEGQLAGSAAKPGAVTRVTPSCPASSQIGTTTVGAGSGPTPFFPALPGSTATGRIFLTGTHSGGFVTPGWRQTRYGVAVEVPAVAGPFDLGTVLVRSSLLANPETGQVRAITDRLPRILQGIVLDARDVRVDLDRPDFTVNPTSCEELQIDAMIAAQDGASVKRSSRFQVGDCAALALAPRVSMRLVGRRQTKLGGNPELRVRLRQGAGQSNLRNVKAILPRTLALDARNAAGDWLCSFEDGQRADCPASSQIGTAKAWSPLLKQPVSGPVYFVKNVRRDPQTGNLIRTLPTLLLKLSGEAEIYARATSASRNGLLISTFKGLPDAKVSRFDMRIKGGASRGILAVSGEDADLCDGRQVTRLSFRGQNGKLRNMRVGMRTPCKRPAASRRKASGGRG